MQAGIVTEDNIAQILRGISQKRRHGVLEVHAGESTLEIFFFQGKIVNLQLQGIPLSRMVAQKLAKRETILDRPWVNDVQDFSELAQRLRDAGEEVSSQLLSVVIQQQALEWLYALEIVGGSFYHFRVEMVPNPTDDELQLSVGQVLLDLVTLKESRDAVRKRLPHDAVLSRGLPEDREYSVEEQDLIWLVDGVLTISQLRDRSLLNRLTFEETLISLLDAGVIVRDDQPLAAPAQFDFDSLEASIDRCVDEAVADADTPAIPVNQIKSEGLKKPSPVTRSCDTQIAAVDSYNQMLLRSAWVPEAVVTITLIAAVLVPYLLW